MNDLLVTLELGTVMEKIRHDNRKKIMKNVTVQKVDFVQNISCLVSSGRGYAFRDKDQNAFN